METSSTEQTRSLGQNLRALPRGVWILFFGTFLNKFGTFVLPFLAIYMTGLGYSAAQAGLAVGAYGIGTLAAALLGGYLADTFGRRKTIVLSMSAVAVAMLCLSQARTLPAIVALSALAGLTGELYRPASSALLADLVPANQRVTAWAAYRMAFNAGWTFGPATAGLLAKKSFMWLFVGDALTSLLFCLVAWFGLPSGLRGSPASAGLRSTVLVLRQDRKLRQLLLGSLCMWLVFVQVFSTMSLEVTRHGFSTSTYGLLISMNGLMVVLFELPLTSVTKRYPRQVMIALGFALVGIGFASNLLPRTLPLLISTMALLTFGEMISLPLAGAYVADLAPAHQRGLYMGAYGLVGAVAFIVGPSVGLWAYSANPAALWSACGVLGLLAGRIIVGRTQINERKLVQSEAVSGGP